MSLTATVPGSAPRAVLQLLADGQPRTVAKISAHSGLPRSTVVHALMRLAEAGEVTPHPAERQGRGRPSRRWSVARPPGPVAVVVATAHGTEVGVVTPAGHVISSRVAEPLEAAGEGRHAGPVLTALDDVLSEIGATPSDLSLSVIGLPGPSDFTTRQNGSVRKLASGHLRRFRTWDGGSPVERLVRHLGRPAYAENDANLAALGEAVMGAAVGLETVMHVSLGHGTGAGLVIRGKLHRGSIGLAGEIGHLHTDDDGTLCHCGARGCFWQSRSVPALLEALTEAHGTPFTMSDVARAAEAEDQDVVRPLRDFGHALGRRLADAAVYLNPDAITVDGGLGGASAVIARGVQEGISRYAPPTIARSTKVLVGSCGEAAALIGAVALAGTEGLFAQA
jgi:predicted NBD/HSP70 family sugar kinase